MQAYNDWHIDEWCGAYPARFIPMAIPVIWNAELCAQEVRRVAELAFVTHWDTFPSLEWHAVCEAGFDVQVQSRPGWAGAVLDGLQIAQAARYEFVITMDPGESHRAQDVHRLVFAEQGLDLVVGSRWT